MQPMLCMIVPLSAGGEPTHPIAPGGQPPGIWPSPGHPAHPIAPGGQPPGYWGGAPPPYPDQGLPGRPPYPSQGPGFPTNPIVLPPYQPGGPPVTIWPSPGHPSHPIVIPPPPPPPPDGEAVKPPPEGGGWGYAPTAGWGYFPPQGEAGPK
jgi:actin cytoskeleton-regulatory complex protein PAN1